MKNARFSIRTTFLLFGAVISATAAIADENLISADEIVSRLQAAPEPGQPTDEYVIESMSSQNSPDVPYTTEGLRVGLDGTGVVGPAERGQGNARPNPSIDLPSVTFEFNSSRLTSKAARQLDELAVALSTPELADGEFLIAGHSDAVGNDDYNDKLSEQRAQAVVDYLVYRHRLAGDRLTAVGWGETRPVQGLSPDDPRNRRVEIINQE